MFFSICFIFSLTDVFDVYRIKEVTFIYFFVIYFVCLFVYKIKNTLLCAVGQDPIGRLQSLFSND